ncbi:MAG TPA: EF-Tu/IF-2/RF-3 family GTPase [Polyangia bacterium]|nr:EF-Tu/IF-2/RF-3 family GTPase [Polyangia bacterium]
MNRKNNEVRVPAFRMLIGNIYEIRGLGPTVTGYIESGTVRVGDRLAVVRSDQRTEVYVTAIQRFQASLSEASAADNPVGISLSGIDRDEIHNRDLLVGG